MKSSKHSVSSIVRLRVPALAAIWVLCVAVPAAPLMGATIPQQGQVEGEVLQVFPAMIVIKNDQGQATILQLTPRTQVGGALKPGDKVVAYVTPYGVSSVQLKAATALLP